MTNENSHEEETNEPEPHAMIDDDGEMWFRSKSGEWQKHEPVSTGDSELDALWEMPADKLDDIVENRNHPLHEKALLVINEVSKPYIAAFEVVGKSWTNILGPAILETLNFTAFGVLEPVMKQLSRSFSRDFIGWIPELLQYSSEGVGHIARSLAVRTIDGAEDGVSLQHAFQEPLPEVEEALPTAANEFSDLVDTHASELPAPSAALIKTFGESTLRLLEEGVEEQARTRKDNREASLEATEWSRKANTKGIWTTVLAALTLVATVVGICVSFFDWSL